MLAPKFRQQQRGQGAVPEPTEGGSNGPPIVRLAGSEPTKRSIKSNVVAGAEISQRQHAGRLVTCRGKYVTGMVQGPMSFFWGVSKSV